MSLSFPLSLSPSVLLSLPIPSFFLFFFLYFKITIALGFNLVGLVKGGIWFGGGWEFSLYMILYFTKGRKTMANIFCFNDFKKIFTLELIVLQFHLFLWCKNYCLYFAKELAKLREIKWCIQSRLERSILDVDFNPDLPTSMLMIFFYSYTFFLYSKT